jgi:hypothetical protein
MESGQSVAIVGTCKKRKVTKMNQATLSSAPLFF